MMQVPVAVLKKLCNPLKNPPWALYKRESGPISNREIELKIARGPRKFKPYNSKYPESRQKHIERIAWLVKNGWGDSYITIDLNYDWIIYDGFHRLASAIYRGDEMIWAEVFGSKEEIQALYEE